MKDLIRDAPIGQIIRYFTKNRVLLYPEEKADFQCPPDYANPDLIVLQQKHTQRSSSSGSAGANGLRYDTDEKKRGIEDAESGQADHYGDKDLGLPRDAPRPGVDRTRTARSALGRVATEKDLERSATLRQTISRVSTRTALQQARTREQLEEEFRASTLEKQPTTPIVPQVTSDGSILVDWYTTDDPENPHNWSQWKKAVAASQVCIYTLAVYMGSSIYTSSEPYIEEIFGVGPEVGALGLALYVLAYGTGPLVFSPLSEIPSVGRNPPYMVTMALFVILSVPAALVNDVPGLLVLRFLQGFFGSPCLATGGASMQDLYSLIKLPYILCLWAFAATCGPAMGPVISGFSVPAENWHWSLWEILWLAGPVFLCMMLFLPETSTPNILLRRAKRLRKLTGDNRLKAQSEIDQGKLNVREVVFEALVRPMQLIILDPAIGFTAGYVALAYGIYYSFFEAFPLVYIEKYGFNLGEMGLTFLSITVAVIVSIAVYWAYIWFVLEPDIRANGLGEPEKRLIPALYASFLLPVGLFLFGWTGNGSIHWIVSVIGIFIFTCGVFVLMQCIFVYLPFVYPQYAASLFAGNDFARSMLAFAAVMFSRPMYIGLGIGPGCSLLGALTAACVAGIFILYFYGARLRARSRFSAK